MIAAQIVVTIWWIAGLGFLLVGLINFAARFGRYLANKHKKP